MKKFFVAMFVFLFLSIPCIAEEFTLGTIQQQIREGMSQSQVVSCLGAPNIVTKDSDGSETWVYEKSSQSTKESYHKSWLWLLFFGRRKGCQDKVTSQKTINLILNFDPNACLETYTYKASSF